MATKDLYAGTATQSLAWSSSLERAVDRVAAAGLASVSAPVGMLLWKARDGLEARAYQDLVHLLHALFAKRYGDIFPIRAAIVEQALHEFLSPQCRECQGTRELIVEELRVPCPACVTGVHRYSDSERARRMQVSYAQTKRAAPKIRWVSELLATEDRRFGRLMADRLGRL